MRLLGNRVMIRRVETSEIQTASGLFVADPFKRGEIIFEVLEVGPGRLLRHPRKNKSVFISPEVSKGELVLSRHWFDASLHPSWHQPEYLDNTDGSGRIVLDARFCIAAWQKTETPQFTPKSHI
jgi:co-chaperonin GroES (HSP10)